eukprot:m.159862 g.159862  ORF g.159862 m.159862 type:complete len:262 (-) comp14541_c0_seq1:1567-2352(-)
MQPLADFAVSEFRPHKLLFLHRVITEPCPFLCSHGPQHLTNFDPSFEERVVLQLGGSSPELLASAAATCHDRGYREFNLNVGCPSEKGQKVCNYGAVLMGDPKLVGLCMKQLGNALPTSVPCTVKCRIGIGDIESYEELATFVRTVHEESGRRVTHFIVHARRAILNARLTPEQNRNIPPLRYDFVYRLVSDFPQLWFTLNGGVKTLAEAQDHLRHGVHGVMIGRAAFKNPWPVLGGADHLIFGHPKSGRTRRDILELYIQ